MKFLSLITLVAFLLSAVRMTDAYPTRHYRYQVEDPLGPNHKAEWLRAVLVDYFNRCFKYMGNQPYCYNALEKRILISERKLKHKIGKFEKTEPPQNLVEDPKAHSVVKVGDCWVTEAPEIELDHSGKWGDDLVQPDVKGASLVSVEDSEPEVIFDLDSTIPEEGWFLADLEQPSIWKGRFGTRSTTEEITEKPTEEQETTDKFQRFRFGLGK